MSVRNSISASFNDDEFVVLERLSTQTHKPKAELITIMVTEFLRDNPNRFRRRTVTIRDRNIVLPKD